MKIQTQKSTISRLPIWITLFVGAAAATAYQHGPGPDVVRHTGQCYTGNGTNAITITLPSDATHHLNAVHIRRKGCDQWSQNLGIVLPGKSIHILNVDDGEMEVFWREAPHTLGDRPESTDTPPTPDEWETVITTDEGGDSVTLSAEAHRRIVVS
jgi:hypothetical protein